MDSQELTQFMVQMETKLDNLVADVNGIKIVLTRCQTKCESKENITKAKLALYGTIITTLATIATTLIVKLF